MNSVLHDNVDYQNELNRKELSVKRFIAATAIAAVMLISLSANAQVNIRTEGSVGGGIPIAVPAFAPLDATLAPLAQEMADVIAYDLEFNGLFSILPKTEYPASFTGFDPDVTRVDLDAWKATKAQYLVYGNVRIEGDQLVARFRLFDLYSKDQLVGQELRVQRQYPRLAAHRFSEEVIRQEDGIQGIGSSEIVFSVGTTGKKEIYVADYDGAGMKQVTQHDSISIKPKLSPDGNQIAYLSYKDRYSYLYVFDRRTGRSTPLSKEVGLNSAPAWSPDGSYLAMTLSKDGNTEIYLKNPDGSNPRRLTKNKGSDTSPVFSPDGNRIAYVSDMGGSPQIYAMGTDGSGVKRLSFQGGNSYDPAWSPDGTKIAYVGEKRGEGLEIYVMNADGSNPQRMSDSSGSNESPSWSADSRHVVFMSTRTGAAQLLTVTVDTGETRTIPRLSGMRCEGPSWGPRRR